jgi:hypothetical protein
MYTQKKKGKKYSEVQWDPVPFLISKSYNKVVQNAAAMLASRVESHRYPDFILIILFKLLIYLFIIFFCCCLDNIPCCKQPKNKCDFSVNIVVLWT